MVIEVLKKKSNKEMRNLEIIIFLIAIFCSNVLKLFSIVLATIILNCLNLKDWLTSTVQARP